MKNTSVMAGAFVICAAVALAANWALRAQERAPLQLTATIRLPDVHGRIDHFDMDLAGKRLFMSALGNNTVEVFDIAGNKRIHTIRGLHEPQGVTFVQSASRIFVANGDDGVVRIFDGKSYQMLKSVHLASDADDTRLDAAKQQVYAGYGDKGNAGLAIFDGATGNELGTIPLPAHPEGFQLEQKGARIYVNVPEANNVIEVVDRSARKIVATWKLGGAEDNFPMALDEADHRLFVVCRTPAELLALDTNSGRVLAKIPSVEHADDVWYDAANKRIYVSGGQGFITVIAQEDADHYRRVAEFKSAEGGRTSLLAPELGKLFLGVWGQNGHPEELRVYHVQP
ncbi:MAG TPA: YncE family protein [Verrucomicrobiae bacterium]|nr:YncE family protein [Verrucomicrobiae bacterium]